MNKPMEINIEEWVEIMKVPEVQRVWDINYGDIPEAFASQMYGAKFIFHSRSRIVSGDMYVLYSDTPRPKTQCLVRKSTGLEVIF
jgi:hypothetical protein